MNSETKTAEEGDSLATIKLCAGRIDKGNWKFIRLRGSAPVAEMIDADDLDLLGTRESIQALLAEVFNWVKAGECHARIRSGSDRKVSLNIISCDGRHRLDLDLWVELRQIDDRKKSLRYESCRSALIDQGSSLQRLPVWIEASIFIHHLLSKRKRVSDQKQISRLRRYAEDCSDAKYLDLSQAMLRTANEGKVSPETAELSLSLLNSELEVVDENVAARSLSRIRTAMIRFWFMPYAKLRMLCVMGCDGCGKTSLSKDLAKNCPVITGTYTGKHLYRKSILYKLIVIFIRPIITRERDNFDDRISPLLYLIASVRLELKLLFSGKSGTSLIDRSIVDFLMVDRKTDSPRFSRFRFLAYLLGKRITHIHFLVPYSELKKRKAEMTEKGHETYDKLMFDHFSKRCPTDYILFNNSGSLAESTETLQRIIAWLAKS